MGFTPVELVGYLASALVVASPAMTSVVRLRIVSLVGSVVFVGYGALRPSIPIIITNAAVAGLNIWFPRKEFAPDRDLGAVPIEPDAPFLLDFLRSHAADIAGIHPEFDAPAVGDFVLLLTRDGLPAGALVGTPDGRTLHLRLDYVMHAYRDSRIGRGCTDRVRGCPRRRVRPDRHRTREPHRARLRGAGGLRTRRGRAEPDPHGLIRRMIGRAGGRRRAARRRSLYSQVLNTPA